MPVKEKTGPSANLSSLAISSSPANPKPALRVLHSLPRGRPVPRYTVKDDNAIFTAAQNLGHPRLGDVAVKCFHNLMRIAAERAQFIVMRTLVRKAINHGKCEGQMIASARTERHIIAILEASGLMRKQNNGPKGASRWHLQVLANRLHRTGVAEADFETRYRAAYRRRIAAQQRRRYDRRRAHPVQSALSDFSENAEFSGSDDVLVQSKKTYAGLIHKASEKGHDPTSCLPDTAGQDLPKKKENEEEGKKEASASAMAMPAEGGCGPAFVCPIPKDEIASWELDWELDGGERQCDAILPQESSYAEQTVRSEPTPSHTFKKAGSQAIASFDELSESAQRHWDNQIVTKYSLYRVKQMVLPNIAAQLDIRRLKVQGKRLRNRDLRLAADMLKGGQEYTVGQLVWRAQRIAMLYGHKRRDTITKQVQRKHFLV